MAPRGFTNPTPKTESARSALSSFTCTLCNKSYSRHPEYEAHISSYDHQHRKRLQDLKQLSRDPNAAEKARRAERRADAEAGLRVIDTNKSSSTTNAAPASSGGGGGGGGFKKGGFKSSFTAVKGPVASAVPKKNVLGDDDEDDDQESSGPAETTDRGQTKTPKSSKAQDEPEESDTEEEYANDTAGGGYYDPRKPTGCFHGCAGYTPSRVEPAR
ncbi:hypothetical protein BDV59DRAFT_186906 [Aspergillus ambiguus]|uniref:putative C2H2 finger domain protein n=1 Tax=Aspergillus ambiguus TaxID=176160 RepID=UPI003CCD924C